MSASSRNTRTWPSVCTDLTLGRSISSSLLNTSKPREEALRSTLPGKAENYHHQNSSLSVKVYMEGIPIGRKVNLFAHDGYDALITSLSLMFKITILSGPDQVYSEKNYVLTYEDQEGDWMLVGDVPWEIFLTSVKKLMITRVDRCGSSWNTPREKVATKDRR
ncbi:auxin-responsive protein IAA31 isoform X1 [Rosa chinensis]|uniref:auxin-responsive protein IAA31 isoform X1 n=1 Tax=Rosa chinensis TaxID=74649 RepID=UPI001AD8A980|nr:auxin-responsive protein IAA31 isoform X1 [Rosa chinensis]XP_040373642.1 auxin-responsive protein IAA31 isoform X1 [Rosa chinensis]XP_040373643.1 auxin-responsive protein IAA31 isoform X1 [Rosa chinensis]